MKDKEVSFKLLSIKIVIVLMILVILVGFVFDWFNFFISWLIGLMII